MSKLYHPHNPDDGIWWSKHRPKKMGDLALPEEFRRRLQAMATRRNITNLLFYGRPGLGKTSTAHLLLETCTEDSTEYTVFSGCRPLSADEARGLRDLVMHSLAALNGRRHLILVDDADKMSKDAQTMLNGVIEDYAPYVRFILTTNFKDKLIDSLASRLEAYDFDQVGSGEIQQCLRRIARLENVPLSDEMCALIIKQSQNDIRKAIQLLEREADIMSANTSGDVTVPPE